MRDNRGNLNISFHPCTEMDIERMWNFDAAKELRERIQENNIDISSNREKIMCVDYPENFKFDYKTKMTLNVFLKNEEEIPLTIRENLINEFKTFTIYWKTK